MDNQKTRELTTKALIADYLKITRRRGMAAETMALRTESLAMRELLAAAASDGQLSMDEIASMANGELAALNPNWLAPLARVCALQNVRPDDREFAIRSLTVANRSLPIDSRSRRFRKLEFELLFESGRYGEARALLDNDKDLARQFYGYYENDLNNPWLRGDDSLYGKWIDPFNAPFRAHRLGRVEVKRGTVTPFDGLTASAHGTGSTEGPLVSVIMTTYRPDEVALRNSVISILRQTWTSLELLIVDDGSGDEYQTILDAVSELDERIRLVRLKDNRGTYLARNAGLALATGEFYTGQDADDWSHPERLERQMSPILADPSLVGTRANAISTTEALLRTRLGYNPLNPNASSLLVRTSLAREIGGYLPARKAADNEFLQRIERYTSSEVLTIAEPLSIVRVLQRSLSRDDFRAGWSHPARRAFRRNYERWHQESKPASLRIQSSEGSPIPIPRRFRVALVEDPALDVVFAGDWRQYGGPQISMLNEIAALREQGLRIGVMHLEAARFMTVRPGSLCEPVQTLINEGAVTEVLYDDEVRVRLLILRYPPILQFPPYFSSNLKVDEWLILANQAPSERDGSEIRYLPSECSANGLRMFGQRGRWVPQGPTVRKALDGLVPDHEIAPFDMPGIINIEEYATDRTHYRRQIPVIGRHSRDHRMKWPAKRSVLKTVYPTDGSVDVRIMGGASVPLQVLERTTVPPEWVVLEKDEWSVRTFLSSIDFFVYFQNDVAYDAFGRAVLEALASGCVAILSPEFEDTFGDAALYCRAGDVPRLIREVYSDPDRFTRQSEIAVRRVREKFSYEMYADLVLGILEKQQSAAKVVI